MKTIKIITVLFLVILVKDLYSNTVIVNQTGFSFSPDTVNVSVGDTVKWVWSSFVHTTTSVTTPVGGAPWSAPLDSAHTTFTYKVTVTGHYQYQCNFHFLGGMKGHIFAGPVEVTPVSGNVPENFLLYQNFPNPFNPVTNIKFDLPFEGTVRLNIFDITGEVVTTLVNNKLLPGTYSVNWDASNSSSGVYFYQIQSGGFIITKKLIVTK